MVDRRHGVYLAYHRGILSPSPPPPPLPCPYLLKCHMSSTSPQRLRVFLQCFSRNLVSLLSGVTSSHGPVRRKISFSFTMNFFSVSLLSFIVPPPAPSVFLKYTSNTWTFPQDLATLSLKTHMPMQQAITPVKPCSWQSRRLIVSLQLPPYIL